MPTVHYTRTRLPAALAGALASFAICLAGCHRTHEATSAPAPMQLDEGTHVTLVSQAKDFSLVKTDDGRQLYIPSNRLVNSREAEDNKDYAVTCKTDVYEGSPPDKVPVLPPPRTGDELSLARWRLPVLFLTTNGREVQLTRQSTQPSFDPKTHELLWFAFTCKNPDCPAKGKGKNGRPFIFPCPMQGWKAGPNGPVRDTLAAEPTPPGGWFTRPQCPECLKIRNPAAETPAQTEQYFSWCQPYVLPEAKARGERLNHEHKARIDLDKQSEPPGTDQ